MLTQLPRNTLSFCAVSVLGFFAAANSIYPVICPKLGITEELDVSNLEHCQKCATIKKQNKKNPTCTRIDTELKKPFIWMVKYRKKGKSRMKQMDANHWYNCNLTLEFNIHSAVGADITVNTWLIPTQSCRDKRLERCHCYIDCWLQNLGYILNTHSFHPRWRLFSCLPFFSLLSALVCIFLYILLHCLLKRKKRGGGGGKEKGFTNLGYRYSSLLKYWFVSYFTNCFRCQNLLVFVFDH